MDVREAAAVIEHHRALFRLKHARTEGERIKYREEVKKAEERVKQFEGVLYGKRIQDTKEADNTGKDSSALCSVWRADKER